MRVWITGATGLAGGALLELLRERGHDIWALTRPGSAARARLVRQGVHVLVGTLPDVTPFLEAPSPDVLFHCAAAWYPDGPGWAERCRAVHVEATRALAELAIERRARLVTLSSVSAMGYGKEPVLFTESSPCLPRDEYGKMKLEADELLAAMSPRGLDYVILRPAVIYGPGSRGDIVLGAAKAISRGRFFLVGRGDAPISLVFSRNLAAAMLYVVDRRTESARVLLVDDGHPTTRAELGRHIARELGRPAAFPRVPPELARVAGRASDAAARALGVSSPLPLASIDARLHSFAFDTTALRAHGFEQPFTPRAALAETIAWWRHAR